MATSSPRLVGARSVAGWQTGVVPIDPPPSAWDFRLADIAADSDVLGLGADLEPGTLLAAYRQGLFPMPYEAELAWWSPVQRGILPLDGLRVSRSLHRSCARYLVTVDKAFSRVVRECGQPNRPGGWITPDIEFAYQELHGLGWAHSVETWSGNELVGGLYGVAIGGLFAGESMFHNATDASKVALVTLVEIMREGKSALLDVQWKTPHLESMGVVEIPRAEYLQRLHEAIALPLPVPFANGFG